MHLLQLVALSHFLEKRCHYRMNMVEKFIMKMFRKVVNGIL